MRITIFLLFMTLYSQAQTSQVTIDSIIKKEPGIKNPHFFILENVLLERLDNYFYNSDYNYFAITKQHAPYEVSIKENNEIKTPKNISDAYELDDFSKNDTDTRFSIDTEKKADTLVYSLNVADYSDNEHERRNYRDPNISLTTVNNKLIQHNFDDEYVEYKYQNKNISYQKAYYTYGKYNNIRYVIKAIYNKDNTVSEYHLIHPFESAITVAHFVFTYKNDQLVKTKIDRQVYLKEDLTLKNAKKKRHIDDDDYYDNEVDVNEYGGYEFMPYDKLIEDYNISTTITYNYSSNKLVKMLQTDKVEYLDDAKKRKQNKIKTSYTILPTTEGYTVVKKMTKGKISHNVDYQTKNSLDSTTKQITLNAKRQKTKVIYLENNEQLGVYNFTYK